jgi:hypothetical protein
MAEGAILDPPEETVAEGEVVEEPTGQEEVPSVFSVTNRYLVGRAEVTPPAEDGSRVLRLFSASGGAVIEANLAPQLCDFVATKLVEVEVIEEAEVVDDGAESA